MRRCREAPSEGWALAAAPSHAEARSASGASSSSLAHARTVRRPLLATPWGAVAQQSQSSRARQLVCGVERTELALMQRRGTDVDKRWLRPDELIRAGWTSGTRRNNTRLLVRRQQVGAALELEGADIVLARVWPLAAGAVSRYGALAITRARAATRS